MIDAILEGKLTTPLRMSTDLGELFAALSAAQGEMTDPGKTKEALLGKYSYKYSDLADLLKIIRPVFARHGLSLLQFPINPTRDAVKIVTIIGHKSGQWIAGDLNLGVADDRPQTLGSAITYGRRYAAGGIAGISPDEDEDGQAAQNASKDNTSKPGAAPSRQQEEQDEGYDPQNREHQDWLLKQLRAKKIPEATWDDVGNALRGRPAADLSKAIAEVKRA